MPIPEFQGQLTTQLINKSRLPLCIHEFVYLYVCICVSVWLCVVSITNCNTYSYWTWNWTWNNYIHDNYQSDLEKMGDAWTYIHTNTSAQTYTVSCCAVLKAWSKKQKNQHMRRCMYVCMRVCVCKLHMPTLPPTLRCLSVRPSVCQRKPVHQFNCWSTHKICFVNSCHCDYYCCWCCCCCSCRWRWRAIPTALIDFYFFCLTRYVIPKEARCNQTITATKTMCTCYSKATRQSRTPLWQRRRRDNCGIGRNLIIYSARRMRIIITY